ncbi:outer membrane protein [Pseudooceanicola sp. MF1-13]|uniref:outer membrane protein n=1 Tax=Pseudooceanicola sp. MF1-13 TaxID=3379095 RepID=UPI0038921B53
MKISLLRTCAVSIAIAASPVAAQDFTGAYIGLGLGGAGFTTPESETGSPYATSTTRATSIIATLQGGYNMAAGNVIYGADLTGMFGNLSGQSRSASIAGLGATFDAVRETSLKSLVMLNGKVGTVSGNTLFYGTAGVAAGRVTKQFTAFNPAGSNTVFGGGDGYYSKTQVGFNVGVGMEWKMTENVSLAAEARYYDLGRKTMTYSPALSPSVTHIKGGVVSFKVNYWLK